MTVAELRDGMKRLKPTHDKALAIRFLNLCTDKDRSCVVTLIQPEYREGLKRLRVFFESNDVPEVIRILSD
ncbi:unnamed protein product, partial [Amoebophrya sp. A25]|eukprot:GSA25T00012985001.1